MFKNITEILKSFDSKQRFVVLISLLITILASIFIRSYFSTTNLAPIQKQLNECVNSQGVLMNQNTTLIQKTKDLTDGYLKIDSILTHFKPDTVYVVKYTNHEKHRIENLSSFEGDTSSVTIEMSAPPPSPLKLKTIIKKGNSDEIMSNLHQMIQQKTKK